MGDDLRSITADIARMESVTGVHELAERRLGAGDAAFVADLGIALWRRYGNDPAPPWQYRSVADRLLRLLTLTPVAIEQALRLISVTHDRRRIRYAASLLASALSADDVAPVFDGGAPEELRACLLHELALRGVEVRHRWVASPHWRHHPLAWLPRSLTPLEGRPELPHYTMGGSSCVLPVMTAEPVGGRGPVPAARETTMAAGAARISAAVADWVEESNGRVEARTFALDADLDADAVGDTLRSVGLESAEGLTSGIGACSVTQAWQQLFTAASAGGAYSSGELGAYGRLLAWRSLSGLAGAAHDASAADVEALALGCSWYSFAGVSDWFDRVAWDIGLAVVSPDRRHLAVLAATDTD